MTLETKTNEYITFALHEETYAIEISNIESIQEYSRITKLPGADDSVKGVIDLRGTALPVVDLRTLLNIEESSITQNTSIIVMVLNSGNKVSAIGALVDSVKEVIKITADMIQKTPQIGVKTNKEFVSGIAKIDETFIIILDIVKLLNENQLALAYDESLLHTENPEQAELTED